MSSSLLSDPQSSEKVLQTIDELKAIHQNSLDVEKLIARRQIEIIQLHKDNLRHLKELIKQSAKELELNTTLSEQNQEIHKLGKKIVEQNQNSRLQTTIAWWVLIATIIASTALNLYPQFLNSSGN
ncbi:MAG: hypothetical protein SFT81_01995 [Candidatus Caenarcaniphilales bacterium]|nr:hypothetical protein [Candidatus Caenarcaniphilales bacterium]